MKKFITICIAMLYTLITSGFSVNLHYCMGELASVDLHDSHNEGCGKCGMPVKGDCCKDEAKFLKLDNTHQAAKAFEGLTNTIIALPAATQPVWLQTAFSTPVLHAWAPLHAPPLITSAPLYVRHCIFLV